MNVPIYTPSASAHGTDTRRALIAMKFSCAAPKERIHAAGQQVATVASKITGGATIFPVEGVWDTDASQDMLFFKNPEVEAGVAIEFTIIESRVEELLQALQPIVRVAAQRFSLPISWCHVDVIDVTGVRYARHFRIEQGVPLPIDQPSEERGGDNFPKPEVAEEV